MCPMPAPSRSVLALLLTAATGLLSCSADEPAPATPGGAEGGLVSTPLRDTQKRTSATRFERLDPTQSGVAFENRLLPAHILPYVYNGSGVAIGDYDADGLPDIYLVSLDGPNKLFRQVAPLRFEDATAAAGGLDGGAAWGTAASFADVDGDGDLDLFVCNVEAPNLLYQNQGDGTFVECAGKFGLATVAASTGAAFADYDNDGDLDLYLLTNRVLGPTLPRELVQQIELPAATQRSLEAMFPPPPTLDRVDGRPVVPDEYRDLYFALGQQVFAAGQRDRLFRNDGYAQFTDVTDSAGIADQGMGLSATWWDYDGDGWSDLYVANDLESPDVLYRNRGDGTFEDVTARVLPHTAYFGMGSDFGDIDNDGRDDFCVADMSSTTHYMSKMLMGNMGDRRWFLMNADPPQYMRNAVFVNSGTGRFLEAANLTKLASTDWTWTVRFADLDDDGWLDFYATNGIPRFDNDPDAAERFRQLWRSGDEAAALDLARSMPPVPEANIAKRNLGGLEFEDVGAAWGLAESGVSHGAAIADLDRDGDLDVVVNNLNAPATVYANRGGEEPRHRILVAVRGARDNTFGVGCRITVRCGERVLASTVTLARGYMSAGEPIAHFGLGTAQRVDELTVRWPSGAVQRFTDLPVDHLHTVWQPQDAVASPAPAKVDHATLFTRGPELGHTHAERDFDDYAVQPLLPHRVSRLGPGMAWGDADGDGRDDVWLGGAAGQPGSLRLARGEGKFELVDGPWTADGECEDMGAVWLDVDSDGDMDLLVVSGGVEGGSDPEVMLDRLYVNAGDGRNFTRVTLPPPAQGPFSGGAVCAADFDRDGDLDVFIGGRVVPGAFPMGPPSAFYRNDSGALVEATADIAATLADVGMVGSALFEDLDGDGWQDLVIASSWQPVRVFVNQRDGTLADRTREWGLEELRGQWNGVASADLDADGDADLIVTNLGLNTKYKADAEHPLRLYAKDFDTNGVLDIIEAKYEGHTLLPVRGKSCSSAAMPFLREKFETFDEFARASLPEIYTEEALESSQELWVNDLHTLVLENRDGTLVPRHLPRVAQISPGFGVAVLDADDDGHLDVVLAQNWFSPEPETGRFDGGLGALLLGGGDLTFRAVPAADSGISLPGDVMAMAAVDLDGDGLPDLAWTENDAEAGTLVRTNRGAIAGLALRLRGGSGNPTAVGARVDVFSGERRVATQTLQAGGGYLTQAPATVWIGRSGSPSHARIQWPDGTVSEHALSDLSGTHTVQQPE